MAEHTFTVNDDDLNVISTALIELPVRVAMPVINKINEQIMLAEQEQAQAEAEQDGQDEPEQVYGASDREPAFAPD